MIGVSVEGASAVFGVLDEDWRDVKRAVLGCGLRIQHDMMVYPLTRPQQRYRRTGRLGRGWSMAVEDKDDEFIVTVRNAVEYAPYVEAKQYQAWMHVGRWPTDEDVLEYNVKLLEDKW